MCKNHIMKVAIEPDQLECRFLSLTDSCEPAESLRKENHRGLVLFFPILFMSLNPQTTLARNFSSNEVSGLVLENWGCVSFGWSFYGVVHDQNWLLFADLGYMN